MYQMVSLGIMPYHTVSPQKRGRNNPRAFDAGLMSLTFFNPFFEVAGEFGKECGRPFFAGEHFLVFFGVVAQLLLKCKLKSFDNVFQCGHAL
jgi:hypothetical protein